jgi:hypothetical protein
MRTTLTVDDAVYAAALEEARRSRRSLGAVVSEWARRGLETGGAPVSAGCSSGFPTFRVSKTSPPITGSQVRQLLEDEGL